MLGIGLVRPLEDDWREVLDAVGRARGWPTSGDGARLAARVAELSAAYNDAGRARAAMREAGAARLAFSLPRDVPKGAAAVRELVATGLLRMPRDRALSVLDVGAGLGAMTWGAARALEAAGTHRAQDATLDATWLDADAQALELGEAVARARAGRAHAGPSVRVRVRPIERRVDGLDGLGRFDLVLLGHVLSELDVGAAADVRLERHAALVDRLLARHVEADGSLVIVEPALRDRTRHLHRLRDELIVRGATVFAPCLHQGACPALERETDWCHEHLPIDLPPWLHPIARAAGLRREGLSFSYVILRRDGVRLTDTLRAPPGAALLRAVSEPMPSKGKVEAFMCGEFGAPARIRVARLNRDATAENSAWDRIARGDVATVVPAPEAARPRIERGTVVLLAEGALLRSDDSETR